MKKNQTFLPLLFILLLVTTGCSKISLEQSFSAQKTSTQHTAAKTTPLPQQTVHGTMVWKDANIASTSLCGGKTNATITFSGVIQTNGVIDGTGTIQYDDVTYSEKRQCTDCVITGTSGTFSIHGTLSGTANTQQTLTIKPEVKNAPTETQSSVQCFGEMNGKTNTQKSQSIYFSLFYAGFFNEWTTQFSSTTAATKTFSLKTADHEASGTLHMSITNQ